MPEEQRKAAEIIEQSGNHLLSLINSVLDISKIEAGREDLSPVNFDLGAMIQMIADMFAVRCTDKGLRWHLERDLPERRVRGDERKLRQVLINLLGNAVKFTSEGQILLRAARIDEEHYRFEVSDTGPGIPEERHKAIFEPFHQESEGLHWGGTGLGLPISQSYVELMGGELVVESAVGSGARFYFEVPLPASDLSVGEDRDWSLVHRLAPGQSVRALVVDDVETNRDILAHMLTRVGVDVDVAASGPETVRRTAARRPDIVFMDLRMPDMDGVETRRRLVETHGRQAMKIVAVSASVLENEIQGYIREGFDSFINKPLSVQQVYACLAQTLGVDFELSERPDGINVLGGWDGLVLPPQVAAALHRAVESHSITDLKEQIDQIESRDDLGDEGLHLAAHLRDLSRQYDLAAIGRVLDSLESTT